MIWHPRVTLAAVKKSNAARRREERLRQTFPWNTPNGFELLIHALGQQARDDIEWAESLQPPTSPDQFAAEVIYVICNSGMKNTVARQIYDRVMPLLRNGSSAWDGFKHKGKSVAIDAIWINRQSLFQVYDSLCNSDAAKLEWLATLPWIGPVTKYHAAKNFGVNCVKPDVHLARLARHARTSPDELCERLGNATGYRAATVDTLLWRACATGLIHSPTGKWNLGQTLARVPHSREKQICA